MPRQAQLCRGCVQAGGDCTMTRSAVFPGASATAVPLEWPVMFTPHSVVISKSCFKMEDLLLDCKPCRIGARQDEVQVRGSGGFQLTVTPRPGGCSESAGPTADAWAWVLGGHALWTHAQLCPGPLTPPQATRVCGVSPSSLLPVPLMAQVKSAAHKVYESEQ